MPKRGLFAMLCGLFHGKGTGAPKITRGSGARFTLKTALFALPALLLASLAFSAAPALAAAPEEPLIAGLEPPTATTAELVGILNPNAAGEAGTFEFLYKKGGVCEGGATAPVPAAPSKGEQYEYAFGKLSGLTPGGEYTACLLAENPAKETAQSAPFSFVLPAEAPVTQPADPVSAKEATLHGVLNPTQPGEPGTYEFVYRQSASECQGGEEKRVPEPAEGAIGAQGEAKEVAITGLLPGTAYTACLLERNALGEPALGNPEMFTTLAEAPSIVSESVTTVEAAAVTFDASIDPGGAATSYHFEYLTEAQYDANGETFTGAASTPLSGPIGSDNTDHSVAATTKGLTPGTTYHYRVLATNSESPTGGTPGPDKTFTTSAAPNTTAETCPNAQAREEQPYGSTLPDCRAYEMVSPLDKNGRGIFFVGSRASSSDESPAVTYVSQGSFSEPKGSGNVSRYLSRREPEHDRWSLQNITPPITLLDTQTSAPFREVLFTPELSEGLLLSQYTPLVEEEPEGYNNLYVADLASSPVSYQTVTNVRAPNTPPYKEEIISAPAAAGASSDLSHVVFQSNANLTAGAKGEEQEKQHVYEWAAGKLSQVDVTPTGTSFEGLDNVGAPGDFNEVNKGDAWHAVSSSGLRVFFTASEFHDDEAGQLYVRENPMSAAEDCSTPGDACTVEVSKSQKTNGTDPNVNPYTGLPNEAFYRDANAEGTRVFFTSRAELTNDAYTGPESDPDSAANLYEYNVETKELTDLTVPTEAEEPEDPDGAAVLGLVTASEDGSYQYFVANGVLASNENSNKETAQPGNCKEEEEESLTGEHTCSLYVEHYNGAGWEAPKFIATLVGGDHRGKGVAIHGDENDWADFEAGNNLSVQDGSLAADYGPVQHAARVTPDGSTLAFESIRSLTGYDNEPVKPGGAGADERYCTENGGPLEVGNAAVPCREVFLYDAVTGKLVCASCDPSGVRPVGPAELGGHEEDPAGDLKVEPFYLARNLSEDGRRLFFQSPDPLVSGDNNGQLDVYEWEQQATPSEAAAGESSCTQAAGCVFPVSDVAGNNPSYFMDASPTGENIFIETADELVPSDTDTREDVYDVRVDGGFPVTPAVPVCASGDACKPPVSPQPGVFAAPASATFSGPGDTISTPAAVVTPKRKSAAEVKAEQLAKALKVCKKEKSKKKRAACEKSARRKYGASKAKKTRKAKKAKKAGNDRRARS
jgi:hypothetical protein